MARWGKPIRPWVGVSCLMSVVSLSHGSRQLMRAPSGVCFACRVFPITCFFFKLLGLGRLTKIQKCASVALNLVKLYTIGIKLSICIQQNLQLQLRETSYNYILKLSYVYMQIVSWSYANPTKIEV